MILFFIVIAEHVGVGHSGKALIRKVNVDFQALD
jgi:hypothetical protein